MIRRKAKLIETITNRYGCGATYSHSVPVVEQVHGEVVWEGFVLVFAIEGHLTAKTAYGWSRDNQGMVDFVALLGLPPITDAQSAVRTHLASAVRNFS